MGAMEHCEQSNYQGGTERTTRVFGGANRAREEEIPGKCDSKPGGS